MSDRDDRPDLTVKHGLAFGLRASREATAVRTVRRGRRETSGPHATIQSVITALPRLLSRGRAPVEEFAHDEYGTFASYRRDAGVTRWRALRAFEGDGVPLWRSRPWRLKVTAEYLRPFELSDCPADVHGYADDDEEYERLLDPRCVCEREDCYEDGPMLSCASDAPRATACWGVEERNSAWLHALRNRRVASYRRLRRDGQPVLWGGAPRRRCTRVERLLIAGPWIGYGKTGSRQQRVGDGVWLACNRCGGVRPHEPDGAGGYRCDAVACGGAAYGDDPF